MALTRTMLAFRGEAVFRGGCGTIGAAIFTPDFVKAHPQAFLIVNAGSHGVWWDA